MTCAENAAVNSHERRKRRIPFSRPPMRSKSLPKLTIVAPPTYIPLNLHHMVPSLTTVRPIHCRNLSSDERPF